MIRIAFLFIIGLSYTSLSAQDCPFYEALMQQASQEAAKANYKLALNSYDAAAIAAKDCGFNKDEVINDAIAAIFDQINQTKEDAIKAKNEAQVLANKANDLVKRLGDAAAYDFFFKEGVNLFKTELQKEVPDLELVIQYLGIAAFAKETQEVQQWIRAYELLTKAESYLKKGQFQQAQTAFQKIQANEALSSNFALYAQKRLSLIAGSKDYKNWERFIAQKQDKSIQSASWTGTFDKGHYLPIHAIPDNAFLDFPKLRSLKLHLNRLTLLPKSICKLQALDTLVVSSNRLLALPTNFGQLQQLSYFKARRNQLEQLPRNFPQLQKLKYLELAYNYFSQWPPELNALPLEYLDLAYNRIKAIEASNLKGNYCKSIKHLDLSGNNISRIADQLDAFQSLEFLDLSDNKLRALPPSIRSLKSLKVLDLSNNPELSIDLNDFIAMPQLEELYLYGCQAIDEQLVESFKAKHPNPDLKVISSY